MFPISYPLLSQRSQRSGFDDFDGEILPGMGIAPPAGFGGFGEEHRALAAALPAPAAAPAAAPTAAPAAPVPNMEMAGASVAAHVSPHIFPVLFEAETGSKAPSPPENNQVALRSRFVLQLVACLVSA